MKQHSFLTRGAAALLGVAMLLLSCQFREADNPVPETAPTDIVYASIDPESKAFMDADCHLFWNAQDRISVFAQTVENREFCFQGADGDKQGTFKAVASAWTPAQVDFFYAASPYRADNAISETGVLTLTLPDTQEYHAGSMDPAAQLMVASSQDNILAFRNVGALLGLQFTGDGVNVRSIQLKGNADEPLAGRLEVTLGEELQHSFVSESLSTTLTLTAKEPVALDGETPTVFWMIVPPTVFSNGFTITVTDPDGKVFYQRTARSLTLPRGAAVRMEPVQVHPVASGAPEKLGIYPNYHGNGTPTCYSPSTMQTSVFEADGKLWARFLEMGSLRMYQLGPIPAQAAAGDRFESCFTVTLAGQEESSQALTLQVISVNNGLMSLTDDNDNYFVVRI